MNRIQDINDFTSNTLKVILGISSLHIDTGIEYISAQDVWEMWYQSKQNGIITLEYLNEVFEYFKGNPLFSQQTSPNGEFR